MIKGISNIVPYEYFFQTIQDQIYLVLVREYFSTPIQEVLEISPMMSEEEANMVLKLL